MASRVTIIFLFLMFAVVTGNSLRRRYVDTVCPKVCSRILRPVCGEVNGVPVSISNKCMLENLINCDSSDSKVWKFIHMGSCRSSDTLNEEEDVTESESTLSEESDASEYDNENFIDNDQVDEVFHWSVDYELKEDYRD